MCPACERDNDLLCITIGDTRVLAMDRQANVRILNSEPANLTEAASLVNDQLRRLGDITVEVGMKLAIYTHVRDVLAAAQTPTNMKGARA